VEVRWILSSFADAVPTDVDSEMSLLPKAPNAPRACKPACAHTLTNVRQLQPSTRSHVALANTATKGHGGHARKGVAEGVAGGQDAEIAIDTLVIIKQLVPQSA
jgi:hypothetical protein